MLGDDMESWLDWLRSSLESMCIRIAFLMCKSRLVVQRCRHAALQLRVCPGYHGNRFRHCRLSREPNPIWQFLQEKVINSPPFHWPVTVTHYYSFLFKFWRLIFPQLTRGPETLTAVLNFPLHAAHFGSNPYLHSASQVWQSFIHASLFYDHGCAE